MTVKWNLMRHGPGRSRHARLVIGFLAFTALTITNHANAEASAKGRPLVFRTRASCAYLCPYVLPTMLQQHRQAGEAACERLPATIDGSYAQTRVQAPRAVHRRVPSYLRFGIDPKQWSDGVICRVAYPGTARERFSFGAFLTTAATCRQSSPLGLDGCYVETLIRVRPGQVFALRIFNGVDEHVLYGNYAWCSFVCGTV